LKADLVSVDEQLDVTSLVCIKSDGQEQMTGMRTLVEYSVIKIKIFLYLSKLEWLALKDCF